MNTNLSSYTDEQLLFEIAAREFNRKGSFDDAPVKTTRHGKHHDITVGVGNDHTATIEFDHDAWLELRKRNSRIVGS